MTINSDPQLNDADLELLSAYIDHRLGDGERATLEQRLSQAGVRLAAYLNWVFAEPQALPERPAR